MQDKNTVTTSTAEPGGGSTSQANGKTGCGLVDMRIWDSPDCYGPAFVYPFIVFLKDKTSEETAIALSEILAGIATPWEILLDNGKEFTGKEFCEVLSRRQIKHITTGAYSPQSNGILECFHRYLGQCIRMSLKHHAVVDKDRYWKGACLAVLEAYRKLPHRSMGECPLFLATGQEPLYTIDHLLPTVP